jgi:hypothetical protein
MSQGKPGDQRGYRDGCGRWHLLVVLAGVILLLTAVLLRRPR